MHNVSQKGIWSTWSNITRPQRNQQPNGGGGGLTLILSGDFRHTLPVIQKGTRADYINRSMRVWNHPKLAICGEAHSQDNTHMLQLESLQVYPADGKVPREPADKPTINPHHGIANVMSHMSGLSRGLETLSQDHEWLCEPAIYIRSVYDKTPTILWPLYIMEP